MQTSLCGFPLYQKRAFNLVSFGVVWHAKTRIQSKLNITYSDPFQTKLVI